MFGWTKSYADLLLESVLPTLMSRRESAIRSFAKKALENPNYSHWFTANPSVHQDSQRYSKPLHEKLAHTTRLYNNPIYHMTRLLNGSPETCWPRTCLSTTLLNTDKVFIT